MVRPRRKDPVDTEADAALREKKLSIEIDTVKRIIETDCLQKYMSKREAAGFLLIQEGRDPAFTETVWEELERQNPEFFRAYKGRVMLKDQITKFNVLLVSQIKTMNIDLHNGVASGSVPNGHPSSSTPAYVSNPNNMQRGIFPSTTVMYHPLSENEGVPAVHSDAVHAPVIPRMHHGVNDANFFHSGVVCAPGMNISTGLMHDRMNDAVPNNGAISIEPGVDPSTRMLDGMNIGPGIYSPATSFATYNSAHPFQQAMSRPLDPRMPHFDPLIQNRTIFPISSQTFQDVMNRYDTSSEANNFSFPPSTPMDIDGSSDGDFSERMINDSLNDFNAMQGEDQTGSDHPYQNPG